MVSALNCSVKQRPVEQAEGRGDNIIPYIYLCKFIPCAEALPTQTENRFPQAILGKLSEWSGGGEYIIYIGIEKPQPRRIAVIF